MADKFDRGVDNFSTPSLSELNDEIFELQQSVNELKSDTSNLKKDFISVFGLFASLVTFVAVEVQVFTRLDRFSLIVGVSSLFMSSLMLFNVIMRSIYTDDFSKSWKRISHPAIVIALLFLLISGCSFYWYVNHLGTSTECSKCVIKTN